MLTMAKPLANGFPIGAIMITDKVAEKIIIGKNEREESRTRLHFLCSMCEMRISTDRPLVLSFVCR